MCDERRFLKVFLDLLDSIPDLHSLEEMLCALVGLAAIIATASAVPAIHYSADATVQKSKWDKYKADFQKAYATEDEVSPMIACLWFVASL